MVQVHLGPLPALRNGPSTVVPAGSEHRGGVQACVARPAGRCSAAGLPRSRAQPAVLQEVTDVKKIIPLVLAGLAALVVVRRQRSAKAEADLWREATTPTV